MTKAHVEKFGEVLLSDPDMSEKLGLSKFLDTLETNDSDAQASSKATFVNNAVEEATSRGLIFSKEEFIENVDVEVLAMQSGELSDLQLESVADWKRADWPQTRTKDKQPQQEAAMAGGGCMARKDKHRWSTQRAGLGGSER